MSLLESTRSTVRSTSIASAAAAVAILVAGCGGSSGSTHLTHDQLVAKANSICSNAKNQAGTLSTPTTTTELVPFIDTLTTLYRSIESQLKGLKPPSADSAEYNQLLSTAHQVLPLLSQLRTAAAAGNQAAATNVGNQLTPLNARFNQLATSLGLTDCSATSG